MTTSTTQTTENPAAIPSLEQFAAGARAWLDANAPRRGAAPADAPREGQGSDSVALFHNLGHEQERALVERYRDWQRRKADAGYGSITWPVAVGGAGLPAAYEDAFVRCEAEYETPLFHESLGVSLNIVCPVILAMGTDEQRARWVPALRRADAMACQLFSEPGAGSDLRAMRTSAVREGETWRVNGQKVWTSGAQFADWGFLIARTDGGGASDFSAFVIDMRGPGVEVRPLRQMSGGASFNEVFLDDVLVADSERIGAVGDGWGAMLTMLNFERAAAAAADESEDFVGRLVLLAQALGRNDDPVVRQGLAQVFVEDRIRDVLKVRGRNVSDPALAAVYSSMGKLAYTDTLARISAVASSLLGPLLLADTGRWGTFAWSELVNGVPGMRLGGGSDEMQRNAIGERALGLPRDRKPGRGSAR
jgi:alkylation response protein AidB-like acyl-CoA dehydrogenase